MLSEKYKHYGTELVYNNKVKLKIKILKTTHFP